MTTTETKIELKDINDFLKTRQVNTYNDTMNADLVIGLAEGTLKYIFEDDEWVVFNGTKWVVTDSVATKKLYDLHKELLNVYNEEQETLESYTDFVAGLIITRMGEGANEKTDPEIQNHKRILSKLNALEKDLKSWITRIGNNAQIEAYRKIIKGHPDIRLSATIFDNKGHIIMCKNGAYNLLKDKWVENNPAYLTRKSANVDYDPEAKCPKWEAYLDTIMLGDKEAVRLLQEIIGSSLLLETKQYMLIMLGNKAGNGKTTTMKVINHLLNDYSFTCDVKSLMNDTGGKAEYHMARLVNKRLVIFNEFKDDTHLANDVVKSMVDGDIVSARNPCGRPFNFKPMFTPILTTNYMPKFGTDNGVKRRIIVMPFNYEIPSDIKYPNFAEKELFPESSGILNWMIAGARRYVENGHKYNIPSNIEEYTNGKFLDQDKYADILNMYFVKDGTSRVYTKHFKIVYDRYAVENGFKGSVSTYTINNEMVKRGIEIEVDRSNGWKFIRGYRLNKAYAISNGVLTNTGDTRDIKIVELDERRKHEFLD